jgi:hypothetical protein
MAIKFACPYCDKISSVPDSFGGKKGKCPNCQKVIEVPDPNADDGGGGGGSGGDSAPADDTGGGGGGGGGDTKDCKYCGESIKRVAKKCKYCGEFLDKRLSRGRGSRGPRPVTNMGMAIAVTLLCCWPVGIVAIIYAAQVNSKYNSGDLAGSRASSEKAKSTAYWAMGLGLVAIFFQIVLIAAGGR